MLALAFGAIPALAPHVGPFVATLIVVAVLLVVAGFAGWRAQRSYGDIRTALRSDLTKRSEEHTSELQSLMRISYAVFCLKKKNKTNKNIHSTHNAVNHRIQ